MANQDSPFGLRAIGKIGQNRDNQGLAEFSIAASATAITLSPTLSKSPEQ